MAMTLAVVTAAAVTAYAAWTAREPRPVVEVIARVIPNPAIRAEDADRLARAVASFRAEVDRVPPLDPPAARDLAGLCRRFWDDRELVLDPTAGPLPEATERRIRADLIELAILSARLEALGRPDDVEEARRVAVARLDEAARSFGNTPGLAQARGELLDGRAFRPAPPTERSVPNSSPDPVTTRQGGVPGKNGPTPGPARPQRTGSRSTPG